MSDEELGTTTAAEQTAEGGQPGAEGDKGDYDSRVLGEPEFALKEVKNKDRHITELHQQLKGYEPLKQFVDALGADNLVGPLQAGVTLQNNPQLVPILEEAIRTGQMPVFQSETPPSTSGNGEESWVDPDVAGIRQELADVKSTLADMSKQTTQRFAQAETRTHELGIQEHVNTVLDEWGMTPEIRAEMSEAIDARVKEALPRAQRGDQQALSFFETLSGPAGVETLQMLINPVVLKNIGEIGRIKTQKSVDPVAEHATPEPGTVRTEPAGKPASHAFMTAELVQQALRKNTRAAGLDPDKAFR